MLGCLEGGKEINVGDADGLADGSGVGIKVRPDPDRLKEPEDLPPIPIPIPIISRRPVACPMLPWWLCDFTRL